MAMHSTVRHAETEIHDPLKVAVEMDQTLAFLTLGLTIAPVKLLCALMSWNKALKGLQAPNSTATMIAMPGKCRDGCQKMQLVLVLPMMVLARFVFKRQRVVHSAKAIETAALGGILCFNRAQIYQ